MHFNFFLFVFFLLALSPSSCFFLALHFFFFFFVVFLTVFFAVFVNRIVHIYRQRLYFLLLIDFAFILVSFTSTSNNLAENINSSTNRKTNRHFGIIATKNNNNNSTSYTSFTAATYILNRISYQSQLTFKALLQ